MWVKPKIPFSFSFFCVSVCLVLSTLSSHPTRPQTSNRLFNLQRCHQRSSSDKMAAFSAAGYHATTVSALERRYQRTSSQNCCVPPSWNLFSQLSSPSFNSRCSSQRAWLRQPDTLCFCGGRSIRNQWKSSVVCTMPAPLFAQSAWTLLVMPQSSDILSAVQPQFQECKPASVSSAQ